MKFGQQKRLLLCGLALLAPLPLPFNEVIGWPALLVFLLVVGLFAWRISDGVGAPLPSWAMNLLGLAYLPILFLDFVVLWQGRLLRPLLHLALFALAVKLFGMKREKDKWHILLLTFFVFVGAMGSSVHPAVVFYLMAFLGLAILVLARFAAFHVLSSYGLSGSAKRSIPMRGFILGSVGLTMIGAIPLFVLLPRLGSPYVVGPGGSTGEMMSSVGLMEQISLDVIGRIRTSRAVAMRVSYETPPPENHEMRFRAGVYSDFRVKGWARGRREITTLRPERDGFFHVAEGQPRAWMTIWLEPTLSSWLVMPVEAVAVDVRTLVMQRDETGLVTARTPASRTLDYRVGMAAESRLQLARDLDPEPPWVAPEDLQGITPRITRLAEEVAGTGPPLEQARRIEAFLAREYGYTLDLVGRQSDHPVEDFLFRWRRGHCEYFASSMVLLLRSQGVPARLVAGFLGGEYSPFEGYYVVRQSDAHAWVEAYLPGDGWQIFDPTPAAGRPLARSAGWSHLFAQAYDYMIFRWDRYVLTYGFFDQVGMTRRLLNWWSEWWRSRSSQEEPAAKPRSARRDPEERDSVETEGGPELTGIEILPLVLLAILGGWWIWRHRPAFSAVRAYRQLRGTVERQDSLAVSNLWPPMRLADHIAATRPPASVPARRVIELYLRESFGGQELDEDERRELQAALREAVQNLRKTA